MIWRHRELLALGLGHPARRARPARRPVPPPEPVPAPEPEPPHLGPLDQRPIQKHGYYPRTAADEVFVRPPPNCSYCGRRIRESEFYGSADSPRSGVWSCDRCRGYEDEPGEIERA